MITKTLIDANFKNRTIVLTDELLDKEAAFFYGGKKFSKLNEKRQNFCVTMLTNKLMSTKTSRANTAREMRDEHSAS